jgi:hypothetical protein
MDQKGLIVLCVVISSHFRVFKEFKQVYIGHQMVPDNGHHIRICFSVLFFELPAL